MDSPCYAVSTCLWPSFTRIGGSCGRVSCQQPRPEFSPCSVSHFVLKDDHSAEDMSAWLDILDRVCFDRGRSMNVSKAVGRVHSGFFLMSEETRLQACISVGRDCAHAGRHSEEWIVVLLVSSPISRRFMLDGHLSRHKGYVSSTTVLSRNSPLALKLSSIQRALPAKVLSHPDRWVSEWRSGENFFPNLGLQTPMWKGCLFCLLLAHRWKRRLGVVSLWRVFPLSLAVRAGGIRRFSRGRSVSFRNVLLAGSFVMVFSRCSFRSSDALHPAGTTRRVRYWARWSRRSCLGPHGRSLRELGKFLGPFRYREVVVMSRCRPALTVQCTGRKCLFVTFVL